MQCMNPKVSLPILMICMQTQMSALAAMEDVPSSAITQWDHSHVNAMTVISLILMISTVMVCQLQLKEMLMVIPVLLL